MSGLDNPFGDEPVQIAYRSLPCSKLKHDNCGDFFCLCQCHQYQIWDNDTSRWFYAPPAKEDDGG